MFIQFALDNDILKFGQFNLKSGRKSPYFFNAGNFDSGNQIAKLAEFYAEMIIESKVEFDVLFGPAYKGIPLVTSVSTILATKHNLDIKFAFDRKEAKDHGEGGIFVGANMHDKKVLLIDDVMTAGTAFKESYDKLKKINAKIVAVALAIDRQEVISEDVQISATTKVAKDFDTKVLSLTNFDKIFDYVKNNLDDTTTNKFLDYRKQYGTR